MEVVLTNKTVEVEETNSTDTQSSIDPRFVPDPGILDEVGIELYAE